MPNVRAPRAPTPPMTVALTGAVGSFGQAVLPRLLRDEQIARVVALDLVRPPVDHPKLAYHPMDLTRPGIAEEIASVLHAESVRAVVHLAFFSSTVLDPTYAHEVEVIGTACLLSACAQSAVRRLVMASTTLVYGASPKNPNFLTEDRALPPAADRFVADRIEAERQVQKLREARPSLRSTILRFAPVLGPGADNPFTRFFGHRVAPMVLGHDPLVQCIHEEDAAEAVARALHAGLVADLNVVGRGVVPLSKAIRLAGCRPIALPVPLTSAALKALDALGLASITPSLLNYLRYLWVADGALAERDLGFKPRYSTREALLALARSRGREAA